MMFEALIYGVRAHSMPLDLWTSQKPEVQSEVQIVSCDEKRGLIDILDLWTSETQPFICTRVCARVARSAWEKKKRSSERSVVQTGRRERKQTGNMRINSGPHDNWRGF